MCNTSYFSLMSNLICSQCPLNLVRNEASVETKAPLVADLAMSV